MISFKAFNEKYVQSSHKEWLMMTNGYFPLSDWLYKEMETDIPIAFRTSNIHGLKSLYKYQGQKKQIPVFTHGSEGVARGAVMVAECLVQLSGKSAIEFSLDAGTILDRNGKRWISPNSYTSIRNNFSIPMLNKLDKHIEMDKQYIKDNPNPFVRNDTRTDYMEAISPKGRQKIITWYYKEAKKLITKKLMKDIIEDIGKGYVGDFGNNEILLHDYQIEQVWLLERYAKNKFKKAYTKDMLIRDTLSDPDLTDDEKRDRITPSKIEKLYDEKAEEFAQTIKLPVPVKRCTSLVTIDDIKNIDVKKGKYPKDCK